MERCKQHIAGIVGYCVENVFPIGLEFLLTLLKFGYHFLEAVILSVVPKTLRRKKDVSGKVVLITGSGSGIGRLLACQFAKLGCHLVLWDINQTGIEQTAREAEGYDTHVRTYTVDLCDKAEIDETAKQVLEEFHHVDILINNAGVVTGTSFVKSRDQDVEKTMRVNSFAHIWTTKAFLPGMISRNSGHLVSIASSAGTMGVNGMVDYCASKFAAVGFMEALRCELEGEGRDGIHTTIVCPYIITTGMFEGAKTRFPSLLPSLSPQSAADQILDAVLINQEVLYLPKILYMFIAVKWCLPTKCNAVLTKFFGAYDVMKDFHGRHPVQNGYMKSSDGWGSEYNDVT